MQCEHFVGQQVFHETSYQQNVCPFPDFDPLLGKLSKRGNLLLVKWTLHNIQNKESHNWGNVTPVRSGFSRDHQWVWTMGNVLCNNSHRRILASIRQWSVWWRWFRRPWCGGKFYSWPMLVVRNYSLRRAFGWLEVWHFHRFYANSPTTQLHHHHG